MKQMKILGIVLMALLLCAALVACGNGHEHVAAGDWQSDATHHWKGCEAGCEGAEVDKAEHVFDKTVAHSDYLKAAATESAKAQYWKSCVCGAASTTEYFESDKTAATVTGIQDISKIYDGTPVAAPTYQTNSTGTVTVAWYSNSGAALTEAPSNAGAYKVKITVAETATHAGASEEKAFTISKAAPELSNVALSPVEIAYGDNYTVNYGLTAGAGAVTVEYKVKNAADNTYTAVAPTNVGAYTARVTVAEAENYLGTSATVDFDITACAINNISTNVVYNGTNVHEIDLSFMGYNDVALRATFESKNVGAALTAVVVLENGEPTDNYTANASTCTVDIVAKSVTVAWTAPASLRFDGTEKTPTAAVNGVLTGDECTVQISKKDGDNVWFGDTFTFEAMTLEGADADNYKLPLNGNSCTSPAYTVTVDEEVAVGEEAAVGSAPWYDNTAPHTMYFSIELGVGYYYFDYLSSEQGVNFVFELYAKGDTATPIARYEVDEYDEASPAFYIETAGVYYVKATTSDVTQYETLTIVADAHATADAYGFCDKGCGTYIGEELTVNSWTDCTLGGSNPKKAYYRFEDGGDVNYNIRYYNSNDEGLSVKCYRMDNNGELIEVELSGTPAPLVASFDGYYYLVFSRTGVQSVEKAFTFQIEETN